MFSTFEVELGLNDQMMVNDKNSLSIGTATSVTVMITPTHLGKNLFYKVLFQNTIFNHMAYAT